MGRLWRVFVCFGNVFLLMIGFSRISSPLGPHFFIIFGAKARTRQIKIWILIEAKVSIAASPGTLVFIDF